MTETVLIAIISAIVGICSGLGGGIIGWFQAKRKQKAEASVIEADAMNSIRQFYEAIITDNRTTVQYYIGISEQNRREIHTLRDIVDKLVGDVCLKKGCNSRIYYSRDEYDDILKASRVNIAYTRSDDTNTEE